MTDAKALILLPRLQVQNANAISGPLTWGFPSPTAFAGFVHALQRRLADELTQGFGGVGIVCHNFDPQVTRPAGKYTHVFNLSRNPLCIDSDRKKIKKNGGIESPSFVEEGRAHMEVSLLITLHDSLLSDVQDYFAQQVMEVAHSLRLAGGTILPQRSGKRYEAELIPLAHSQIERDEAFRKLRRRLLPGFALVQREDRLTEHLQSLRETQADANALDALLDLSRLNYEPDMPNPEKPDDPEAKQWGIRKHAGWLVPVPVGYAAISPLYPAGEVRNARDNETPFAFVENLYSLGEWVSPHRITSLQQLLWQQEADVEKGLYLCRNRYAELITETITNKS